MRIAFVTSEFPPDTGFGGIGTYTNQVATFLLSMGHEPEVFTASFQREITEKYNGYTVNRVKISELNQFKNNVLEKFSKVHEINLFQVME